MTTFFLMRHARTQWNLEKRIQGSTDQPLCPQGEEQARRWAGKLTGKPFARIVSSPMKRAVQTASILAASMGVDVETAAGLCEQDFGRWEGKIVSDLRRRYPGQVEEQERLGWQFGPPGGESRTSVLKRAAAALRHIAEKQGGASGNLLVICHSSVIKCLVYHALGRSFDPDGEKVLKPYHLHELFFRNAHSGANEGCWAAGQLNALNLEKDGLL